MNTSKLILLASLSSAIVIAACSDATTASKQPGPATQLSGKSGGDSSGTGSGTGSGNGTSGTNGGGSNPDTVTNPPPQPGWPRSVLGTVYGVTFTPDQQDTVTIERVPSAKVDLYRVPTPVAPNYDSLPPVFYATTTADANGDFTFRDLPQSGYQLKVTPPAGSPYKPATIWFMPQSLEWKLGVNLFR